MELPSIRQLECLVAVAETLNFRQAADLCFMSQPALSAQIRQLETALGLQLFERDRRRVIPTAAGAELAEQARRTLSLAREFVDVAHSLGKPLSAAVRMGIIPTVAPYCLPRVMTETRRHFPDLGLFVREGQTRDLVRLVDEGELDVVLLALEADLGSLEVVPTFEDRFFVAAPSDHPLAERTGVTEDDLLNHDVLLLEDGHCLRDQALEICERGGACERLDLRSSSLATLIEMVASGVGITLLPELALDRETRARPDLRIVPFEPPAPGRTIGLGWRAGTPRVEEFRLLGDMMRETMLRRDDA